VKYVGFCKSLDQCIQIEGPLACSEHVGEKTIAVGGKKASQRKEGKLFNFAGGKEIKQTFLKVK